MIPHYSVIANVIQMAHYMGVKDETRPKEMQRYLPGSRIFAGKSFKRNRVVRWDIERRLNLSASILP